MEPTVRELLQSEASQKQFSAFCKAQIFLAGMTLIGVLLFSGKAVGLAGLIQAAAWALFGAGIVVAVPAFLLIGVTTVALVEHSDKLSGRPRGLTGFALYCCKYLITFAASAATVYSTLWFSGAIS